MMNKLVLALVIAALGWTQEPAPWKQATAGYEFAFPRDHASHPDYKIEWWYYTGNLQAASGRRLGYQVTFFRVGVDAGLFQKPTLKRHKPATKRRNTGEGYRGCLIVSVLKSRRLYWLIEGIVMATVNSAPVSASTADGEFDTLTRNDRP